MNVKQKLYYLPNGLTSKKQSEIPHNFLVCSAMNLHEIKNKQGESQRGGGGGLEKGYFQHVVKQAVRPHYFLNHNFLFPCGTHTSGGPTYMYRTLANGLYPKCIIICVLDIFFEIQDHKSENFVLFDTKRNQDLT